MNHLHARSKHKAAPITPLTALYQPSGAPTFGNQQSVCARSGSAIPGMSLSNMCHRALPLEHLTAPRSRASGLGNPVIPHGAGASSCLQVVQRAHEFDRRGNA